MNEVDAPVVLHLDFEHFEKMSFLHSEVPKSGAWKSSVLNPTFAVSSCLVHG